MVLGASEVKSKVLKFILKMSILLYGKSTYQFPEKPLIKGFDKYDKYKFGARCSQCVKMSILKNRGGKMAIKKRKMIRSGGLQLPNENTFYSLYFLIFIGMTKNHSNH
jgi:hypothetical protein